MTESAATFPIALADWLRRRVASGADSDPIAGAGAALPPISALPQAFSQHFEDPAPREQVLQACLEQVGGERAFLVERDAKETWRVIAARSFDGEEIRNPDEKVIPQLLARAYERREGVFIADLEEEKCAEELRRKRQPRTRSLLILPLLPSATTLYIDHRFQRLEIEKANGWAFGWLFTLLLDGERARAAEVRIAALDNEMREARRALRGRRGHARPESGVADAAPRARGSAAAAAEAVIVGESPEMKEILQLLARVSNASAPVLINGESGTGKELVARDVHWHSDRAGGAFISENCAALAETLLETELFGHVRGAYTGASEERPGLFELASGGTLFLDEIGDTSPGMQKKLLRVLQEGMIRRVGGSETIKVDVRIISATNKDLHSEVERGAFREDLYYSLNVIHVPLPPLRRRLEDLPLLVDHFLAQLNAEAEVNKSYTPEFVEALRAHHWPGNIRELQNQIRRVFALSDEILLPEHLSPQVRSDAQHRPAPAPLSVDSVLAQGSLSDATEKIEKEIIAAALLRCRGNKAEVCSLLKIPKTTLYAKLKRYGLAST